MPKITVTIDVPQRTINRIVRWFDANRATTKNKRADVHSALSQYANQWFGPAGEFGAGQVDAFMVDYLKLPAGTVLPATRAKKPKA